MLPEQPGPMVLPEPLVIQGQQVLPVHKALRECKEPQVLLELVLLV